MYFNLIIRENTNLKTQDALLYPQKSLMSLRKLNKRHSKANLHYC